MKSQRKVVARDRCSEGARDRCSRDARDRALAGLSSIKHQNLSSI